MGPTPLDPAALVSEAELTTSLSREGAGSIAPAVWFVRLLSLAAGRAFVPDWDETDDAASGSAPALLRAASFGK